MNIQDNHEVSTIASTDGSLLGGLSYIRTIWGRFGRITDIKYHKYCWDLLAETACWDQEIFRSFYHQNWFCIISYDCVWIFRIFAHQESAMGDFNPLVNARLNARIMHGRWIMPSNKFHPIWSQIQHRFNLKNHKSVAKRWVFKTL